MMGYIYDTQAHRTLYNDLSVVFSGNGGPGVISKAIFKVGI